MAFLAVSQEPLQVEFNCNRDTERLLHGSLTMPKRVPFLHVRKLHGGLFPMACGVGLGIFATPICAYAQSDGGVVSEDVVATPEDAAVVADAALPIDVATNASQSPLLVATTPTPEVATPPAPVVATPQSGGAVVRVRPTPSRGAGDIPIPRGMLGQVPVSSAGDVLRLAPGIFLSNGLGEGHADQVFLRGFDARIGQDLEFTVNGVPINEPAHPHGQGHADTHFLIPELVESVRVLEGPFDPHQADFAVAGSAHYTLRMPTRGAVAQYRVGSFQTHRALLLWGPEGESAGTFGGIELATSDGYGQNRSFDRATGNAQYEGHSGSLTWRVLLMSYATRYRSAGVLRQDDVSAGRVDFFGTYDSTQGSEVTRHQLSAELESARENVTYRAQAWAGTRTFRLRENFTGFLLDTQRSWQSPHDQRGDAIDQSAHSVEVGGRASARYRTTVRQLQQQLELGLYARHVGVDSSQQRLRATTDIPYRKDFELTNAVSNLALYVDAEIRPWRLLVIRGGVRGDLFQYDVLDQCAVRDVSVRGAPLDEACLSADRSGYRIPTQRRTAGALAFQPRASVLLGPWKGMTLSLAGGMGSRSADPVYLGNDQQGPFSPVTAGEVGVVFDRSWDDVSVNARALAYYTHVGTDLIFDEQQGRNTLASGTARYGALAAARVTGSWFDIAGHFTWARATYDDTGLAVPYVPPVVTRLDASVMRSLPFVIRDRAVTGSASLGVTWVAPRPLPLSEKGDAVFTIDAQASLRWTHIEVGIVGQNLLDAQYRWGQFNYVSDFRSSTFPTLVATRHFSAGPPRSLFAVLTVYLGSTAARHGAPTESP
jgi:iron complex outermembrane recepter protein